MSKPKAYSFDPYLLTWSNPEESGLPVDIFFVAGSFAINNKVPPVVLLGKDQSTVLSISDCPCIISGEMDQGVFIKVAEYIKKNKSVILGHWYGESCSYEMASNILRL